VTELTVGFTHLHRLYAVCESVTRSTPKPCPHIVRRCTSTLDALTYGNSHQLIDARQRNVHVRWCALLRRCTEQYIPIICKCPNKMTVDVKPYKPKPYSICRYH